MPTIIWPYIVKSNETSTKVSPFTGHDIDMPENTSTRCRGNDRQMTNRPASASTFKPFRFGLFAALCLAWLQQTATADTMNMEVIDLQNRPANEIQPLLAPLLESGEAVTGDGFTLIVKANPSRQQEIRKLIQKLDGRLHNLIISVLQTSHKTAAELNTEAAVAVSPDRIQMHGMSGNTRDFDSRRTAQQLRTLEDQAAHIEIGEIRPVENVTIYGYGYPGASVNTQLQQAGTGFAVIPHLQADGNVLIDIEPWSDRFLRNGRVETQNAHTSIRTRLGKWIEIGSIGAQNQRDRTGFNGLNYSTHKRERRILIKVDLAD